MSYSNNRQGPPPEQLWKSWDRKARKQDFHATIYSSDGSQYKGEWKNDKKHGKGIYIWKSTGDFYEGDFANDMRTGFGTLTVKTVDGKFQRKYAGGWKNNMKHGYGNLFFSDNEYYEGEFYADKRNGWGRMFYADGSTYEGQWLDDKRHGTGMLRLANDNRYEGEWRDNKKHGHGKFFYVTRGQLMEGLWVDDICKAGQIKDFGRDQAILPTPYPIPDLSLAQPDQVLAEAEATFSAADG
ncbi:unnamed protein product [Rotaria socialis]|uniref:MORN repeat-containing protein 3 n=1 Tax=Rotaria socialis TaxID=392032 RepID=A0A820VL84_9BILA|nr:unnamed protein product [Rotaria socialis]CAF3383134.1 unnamed protein product [Rotaria socialis]CAF3433613.1 unnamed protein product [Rotaria socialis]CAF3641565.1 unnamed protein product [Rotaria socialis]CAF3745149.1 unnamed protein product [Rotaria socialis]